MIDIGWLRKNGPCKEYTENKEILYPDCFIKEERAMYVLLSGRVDVSETSGSKAVAVSILPGAVFGGREFFSGVVDRVYTAAVDSVVYMITETTFSDLSWSQPDIVFEILKAAYTKPECPTAPVKTANTTAPVKTATVVTAVPAKTAAPTAAAPVKIAPAAVAEAAKTQEQVPSAAAKTAPAAVAAPAKTEAQVPSAAPAKTQAQVQPATPSASTNPEPHATTTPAASPLFPAGHKKYPGITKPEYSKLAYPKEYICPICKKQFTDYKIFSSKLYESAPTRYDMRRFYRDFQPEWYEVVTCRHCYFSAVYSYYNEGKPVFKQKVEGELAAAKESLKIDFDAPRDIDYVFTAHYLALMCSAGYLSAGIPVRAKLWGNLSWLYEDVGDAEMERFAADKAAEAYEAVYTSTRLTPVQEQTTCLSIAGMQRRAGVDRDMRKILFNVKTVKMGEKVYIKMAEDFMEDLKRSSSDGV